MQLVFDQDDIFEKSPLSKRYFENLYDEEDAIRSYIIQSEVLRLWPKAEAALQNLVSQLVHDTSMRKLRSSEVAHAEKKLKLLQNKSVSGGSMLLMPECKKIQVHRHQRRGNERHSLHLSCLASIPCSFANNETIQA